jgi:hypothetical protein
MAEENRIIDNRFGLVTSKRVTYYAKKGWFGGGRREDVPLKQVVSVRYEVERKVFWGILLIVIGIISLFAIIGIVPLVLGVLFVWGSPTVNVITAGGTSSPVVGLPWQTQEAEQFANALRQQLFEEE